jgi:hypothetical protein
MKKRTVVTSETRELWIIRQGKKEDVNVYSSVPSETQTTPELEANHGSNGSPVTSSETSSLADTPNE